MYLRNAAAPWCAASWLLAFLLAFLLTASPITAQDDEEADPRPAIEDEIIREEITVTANRSEVPTREVGSSVTVIGREEIERRRKTTVAELLRTVPGVAIARTSGPGSQTSVFLRGAESNHTLVLLDGLRLNSSTAGLYDFADLTTENLERIEIVRGPQSTLYGSEALGGVISITTRRGEGELSGRVAAEAGSDSHQRLQASISGATERFDYSAAVAESETDGISAASVAGGVGALEADGHENLTASGRFGLEIGDGGRLDLSLRHHDTELEVDGFGPVDDPNALQARESTAATLAAALPLSGGWTQTFRAAVYDETLVGSDPDTFFNNFAIDTRTAELGTQANLDLGSGRGVIVGASWEERTAEVAGGYDESSEIGAVYAQVRTAWRERLFLTLGGRWDDHSEFGSETTYRVTASFEATGTTRLHASLGTGFRAPSLDELFFPVFGNLELEPETSEGFDLGVERTFAGERGLIDLTYFDNDFDDLIGFDDAFRAVNVDRATSRGVELSLRWRASERFELSASHTWNETEDLATGFQLARRPENRTVLDFFFQPTPAWDATVTFMAVADRVDTGGRPLEDYTRVDLTVDYEAGRAFEPYLRIENLLGEDYEEILGFQTPGFQAAVGLGYEF